MRFEASERARMRRHLLDRGRVLATLLADVLAGKPAAIPPGFPGKPGMKPEEKLRAALDHVEARRRMLDAADDAFGRCTVCKVDLGSVALGEMPWADRCQDH